MEFYLCHTQEGIFWARILRAMNRTTFSRSRKRGFVALILLLGSLALFAGRTHIFGQGKASFPDGYDAV
jgi:hypothetical protein